MIKTRLSSRERLLAAMTCSNSEDVPLSPYISPAQWWGEPLLWRNQFERAQKMLALEMDPIIDIWLPEPALHPEVIVKEWRNREEDDTFITKEYHTPAGVLRQTVKETSDWCDALHHRWNDTTLGANMPSHYNMHLFDDYNVSRRLEPWVKGPEDLEKLRYLIRIPTGYELDKWRMDADRAVEFAREHGLLVQSRRTIVGDSFQWFCDIPEFCIRMIEAPGFVEEFLGIFHDWAIAQTQLVLDLDGVDVCQRRGWYETPTFWGPNYWREYLAPSIQKETELVHQAGKLHCYLLPEGHGAYVGIIKDLDVDILMGIDPRMLFGGDLRSLFDALGEKKALWGGVNAEVILESADMDVIDEAVKTAIESMGGNGGLVLSAFLFQQITVKSIMMLVEAWKRHRGMWAGGQRN